MSAEVPEVTVEMLERWARELVAQGTTVLHVPSGVVGKALRAYGPFEYVGENGPPPGVPVLGVDSGRVEDGELVLHHFLVHPNTLAFNFEVLTPVEVNFFRAVDVELEALMVKAIGAAASAKVDMQKAELLLAVALTGQVRALQPKGGG